MNKTNLLDELFENDYVTRVVQLSESTPKIKVKTLSFSDQEGLELVVKELVTKLTQRQFVQAYALEILSRTLVHWGTVKYPDAEGWKEFLKTKNLSLIQKILKEQEKLEKDLKSALNIEEIQDEFFPEQGRPEESKPSREELTQGEKDLSEK